MPQSEIASRHTKLRVFTDKHLSQIPQLNQLTDSQRRGVETLAAVLPFRVNQYVLDELIDWTQLDTDPIFRLVFPQREMLSPDDFSRVRSLLDRNAPREELARTVGEIRETLNPHPAGQLELNVPKEDDAPIPGIQHKYDQTLLFFPSPGQTCHTYCTYCFRWAQFIGDADLRFASNEAAGLTRYLMNQPAITDVLITGGDPMVMKTRVLERFIEPLLAIPHLRSIRIGTKSLAWWPHRFVTDPDADDLMRLFDRVRTHGKHLAVMAHSSHPRELSTPMAQAAIKRLVTTGTTIRCQAPLIRGVNDHPNTWADLWQKQVELGAIPYYMFVERDTGPRNYFEVPLARALDIFNQAYRQVSGLARTVRGPSMSATPGKVMIDGVTQVGDEKLFVLKFIQGRNAEWAGQVFFAKFDPSATWLDDLQPAFGASHFFFEKPVPSHPHEQLPLLWKSTPSASPQSISAIQTITNKNPQSIVDQSL
ncbi:MAG: lysine 2,3-aminomutase [Myxococcota bacterium]|nr:lysine 2,3-aminomutase [Myxococcota bacterium]